MNSNEYLWALLRLIIALPFVLFLAYFGLRYILAKKYPTHAAQKGGMHILDRLALSPKNMLCVVKVDKQIFLLALSETNVQLLKELEEYPEPEERDHASNWFLNRLRKAGKGVEE